MKRRRGKIFRFGSTGRMPALLCLSGCFLCGILAGCIWADSVAESSAVALNGYIQAYLDALREGNVEQAALSAAIWEHFRWPAATVLLSVTPFGLAAIPALFAARGFLLSFSVACFIRVLGTTGLILAVVLFGLTGLLNLPVLFVLGLQGVRSGRLLWRRLMGGRKAAEPLFEREDLIRCGLCAGILGLCVCMERSVLPALLALLAGTF